jgi:hypothetical protein
MRSGASGTPWSATQTATALTSSPLSPLDSALILELLVDSSAWRACNSRINTGEWAGRVAGPRPDPVLEQRGRRADLARVRPGAAGAGRILRVPVTVRCAPARAQGPWTLSAAACSDGRPSGGSGWTPHNWPRPQEPGTHLARLRSWDTQRCLDAILTTVSVPTKRSCDRTDARGPRILRPQRHTGRRPRGPGSPDRRLAGDPRISSPEGTPWQAILASQVAPWLRRGRASSRLRKHAREPSRTRRSSLERTVRADQAASRGQVKQIFNTRRSRALRRLRKHAARADQAAPAKSNPRTHTVPADQAASRQAITTVQAAA